MDWIVSAEPHLAIGRLNEDRDWNFRTARVRMMAQRATGPDTFAHFKLDMEMPVEHVKGESIDAFEARARTAAGEMLRFAISTIAPSSADPA